MDRLCHVPTIHHPALDSSRSHLPTSLALTEGEARHRSFSLARKGGQRRELKVGFSPRRLK